MGLYIRLCDECDTKLSTEIGVGVFVGRAESREEEDMKLVGAYLASQ